MSFSRTAAAASAAAFASLTLAGTLHDIDVILEHGPEGITTHRVLSGNITAPERVFDADMISFFGNIATEDPGFNSRLGEFPPFAVMSLDIADQLRVWNGAGFDPVDPAFFLEIDFLGQQAVSPTTPGELVPGPLFNATEFGDLHNHPDHFLVVNEVPGIYLGAFKLSSDDLGDSEIFYFVYRWEPVSGDITAAEAEQQVAIQWVRDNLLAPPCSADLSGDGVVDASDLASLIAAWGTDAADLDGDGATSASDLAALIAAWGPCD